MQHHLSIANLLPIERRRGINGVLLRLLDKIVGIRRMDHLYQLHKMQGLSKEAFADKLLEILDIQVQGIDSLLARIPKTGPLLLTSNHPFGGIEGVILARHIAKLRPDLKVLANQGLKLFPELSEYFIFTDPLSEGNPKNAASLRQSLRHLQQGGALLMFPAGRVSYYRKDLRRIADHNWNRLVASLIQRTQATLLPVFVDGQNSPWFYRLGRIYYRFRLMMLARELLNKQDASINVSAGTPIEAKRFNRDLDQFQHTALCRALTYAQSPQWHMSWPPDPVTHHQPLAEPQPATWIFQELDALPVEQHLLDYKEFSVYFGWQHQLPCTVKEIARLRERVFREHNEGSGEPLDTDHFDATYTQLFVINRDAGQIIGAYRMGQTDRLLAEQGMQGLYLSRMFEFKSGFVNQQHACLEMGRSFLIPEYQRSFQGLYLLWRGIGAFVSRFPHYRTLYGTVSLSKLYDPRSVAIIREVLVKHAEHVSPRHGFSFPLQPELADLAKAMDMTPHLGALLAGIERDGKDIPILLKHYMKLGARFHAVGLDKSFNDTPGLLLSVDLPKAPEKQLKLYMGDNWQDYRDWQSEAALQAR